MKIVLCLKNSTLKLRSGTYRVIKRRTNAQNFFKTILTTATKPYYYVFRISVTFLNELRVLRFIYSVKIMQLPFIIIIIMQTQHPEENFSKVNFRIQYILSMLPTGKFLSRLYKDWLIIYSLI